MLRIILILLATLSSNAALAFPGEVHGTVTYCCASYWSTTTTTFDVRYVNDALPAGSQVKLRHGFTRSEFVRGTPVARQQWADLAVRTMPTAAPGEWTVSIDRQTYSRGSSEIITAMNFVFEITLPDGSILWDKGSDTAWGYYEVATPQDDRDLPVLTIEKN